jgi:hypothetical protein
VPIPDSFLQKLAKRLGVAPEAYQQFATFMNDWQPWEGGHTNNSATWNFLNTTQGGAGATGNINSVGVKAFSSEDAGVEATAATLENGYYPSLLKGLKTGAIDPKAVAPEIRKWGTTGFANQLDPSGGGGGVAAAGGDGTTGNDAWFAKYSGAYAQFAPLNDKVAPYMQKGVSSDLTYDPVKGLVVWTDTGGLDANGKPQFKSTVVLSPQEYTLWSQLDGQIADMETEYQQQGGDINAAIKNATDKYNREFDVRANAAQMANQQAQENRLTNANAEESLAKAAAGEPGRFGIPTSRLPNPDELFNRAVSKLKDGLPAIPDMPASQPSLGEVRRRAAAAMPVIPPPLQPVPDRPAGVPGPAQSLPDFPSPPQVNPPDAGAQWQGARSLLPAAVPAETANKRRTGSLLFGNPIYGTRPALPPLPFYDRIGGR